MQQHITKPDAPCSICEAEPTYRIWSRFIDVRGATNIYSKKHKVVGSPCTPLVCTACGYVQFFVNPEDFRD
jgi:hypothetical protein